MTTAVTGKTQETLEGDSITPEESAGRQRTIVLSTRLIITTVAVTITTLAVLAVGTMMERKARHALASEIETRLLLEAQHLALVSSDALLNEFPELTLNPIVTNLQSKQPELVLAVVVDHESKIQGHADSRRLGTVYTLPQDLKLAPSLQELHPGVSIHVNEFMLVASAPVTGPSGHVIGNAFVGLNRHYMHQLVTDARTQAAMILGVVLILGVVVTLLVITKLLEPLVALRMGLERIGRGDFDTRLTLRERTDIGVLAASVNEMAKKLKSAQVNMVERERLAHELDLARQIQGSLLPTSPTVAGDFLIEGTQSVAAEVGGDYYDSFQVSENKIGVAVADVSGKGLAGCMVMSMLSVLLKAFKDLHDSPSELLIQLDEHLSKSLRPGTFVTMFYGVLDTATGTLVYASAGHCPTLIYRAADAKMERQLTTGIPLGAIRNGSIKGTLRNQSVQLQPGDMLLQYTDGINEAFAGDTGEQFGFDRMETIITKAAANGNSALLDLFRDTLDAWRGDGPQQDDETLLLISRKDHSSVDSRSSENGADTDPFSRPLERLAEAEAKGEWLVLSPSSDDVEKIRDWLISIAGTELLKPQQFNLLLSALHEVCGNISEHGYGQDTKVRFRLWWVSQSGDLGKESCASGSLRDGYFLILDQGSPFSADNWEATDFSNRDVWRQGRGFGLDIIFGAMSRVIYKPSTPKGNVTILTFDPEKLDADERKLRHA